LCQGGGPFNKPDFVKKKEGEKNGLLGGGGLVGKVGGRLFLDEAKFPGGRSFVFDQKAVSNLFT